MKKKILIFSLTMLVAGVGRLSADSKDAADRLRRSAEVLTDIMKTPDQAIPQDLLNRAECAVIVPSLKKGAFMVGAQYGKGFLTCRTARGWSAPGAIKIEGGSVGFQIGGQETEVVLLVMNNRGRDSILSSQFTLGAGGSVAAGPVGRTTDASTDAYMRAEILSWSRNRGVFAGISLQGATLRQDTEENEDVYGRKLENRQIVNGKVRPPAAAKRLLSLLSQYSARPKTTSLR